MGIKSLLLVVTLKLLHDMQQISKTHIEGEYKAIPMDARALGFKQKSQRHLQLFSFFL